MEEEKIVESVLSKLPDNIVDKAIEIISGRICKRCMKLLSKAESEFELCKRCESLSKGAIEFERQNSINRLMVNIENIREEIKFKQHQIDTKEIVETRVIKREANGTPTLIDGYLEDKKPEFILKNEIRQNKNQVDVYKGQISLIEKARKEDEATDNKGDKGKTV